MSRYIEVDHLKKSVEELPDCYNGFSDTYDKSCIIGLIDEEPTADVVSVVRCKDCMYGVQEELFDLDGVNHRSTEWHCVKNDLSVVDDWFCADGER